MSCDNLEVPKPLTTNCLTNIFGIPYGQSGRTVGGVAFPVAGIVLHCEPTTASELCNEMKCRTRSSIITGSYHNSYHYSIGAATSPLFQHVDENDISWSFGSYKQNTYTTPPPPSVAINWPALQGLYGVNTTPDVYTIDIALAIGHIVDATQSGCYTCPTSSGLTQSQHDILIQLLAYLAQEHNLPIDAEHINFHDNIACGESQECACTDIDTLLAEVAAYCPPCEGDEAPSAPEAEADDNILYIMGITEPCCPESPGCYVKIPWNACFIGDLAVDGDLTDYILGLAQDPVTGQWCLTRGCLAVTSPILGCGTVNDPLRLDRCAIETWLDSAAPLSQVNRVMGTDDNGCWTLEDPDSFIDRIICANPENDTSIPTHILAKTDVTCPEWVTPCQLIEAGLTVADSHCIDFTFANCQLSIEPIIAPTLVGVPNMIECRTSGLYVPQILPVSGECVTVTNNLDGTYTVDLNLAAAQGGVDNNLQCIAGAGVYVPASSLAGVNGNCVSVTVDLVAETVTTELIVSPDANNILECRANGAYVGFAVQNTDCINLGFTGGILTATPAISIPIGGIQNALECHTSGMYVQRGADALTEGVVIGNGSDTNPITVDFSLLDAQDLCDIGQAVPVGNLVNLVGLDGAGCLRRESGVDVIARFFEVDDTNCINLTMTGNVLSAAPVLAPTQASVPNALTCLPTGLYVPEAAGLSVANTPCINMSLVSGVLSAVPIIDPAGDNALICRTTGLYVPDTANLVALDTSCVSMTILGDQISADIIVAGAQSGVPNRISCIPGEGLYVPETAGLQIVDTACIDLTLTSGVLSASTNIAPPQSGVPNSLQCIVGQGLYVPTPTVTTIGPSPAGGNIIGIDIDGDGTEDAEWCEGFCTIVSANNCVGGVGADYMVREFSLAGDVLTVEGAPEHTSLAVVSSTGQEYVDGPTGAPGDIILLPATNSSTVFTNPSTCRDMQVVIDFTGYAGSISVTPNPGASTFSYAVQYEIALNGTPLNNPAGSDHVFTMVNADYFQMESEGAVQGYKATLPLAPGGTLTVTTRAWIRIGLTPVNINLPNTRVGADVGYLSISGTTI